MSNRFTTTSWPSIQEAVNEGALIDLTFEAHLLGLSMPVVATCGVAEDCLVDSDDPGYQTCLKLNLRLVRRLAAILRTCPVATTPVTFHHGVQFKADPVPGRLLLKAVPGPGDGDKLCLTVMLPDEN